MKEHKKPSIFRRLKWVFTGRPLTREEMNIAQASLEQDPMTRIQMDMRGTRNMGGFS